MLRTAWLFINILFWTPVLATLGLLVSLVERRGRFIGWIARLWSRIVLLTAGVSYTVQGLENLKPQGRYVFAANHASALDIPLIFAALPYHMVTVAKIELRKIPFFGWAMRRGGHIFVNRINHQQAMESLQRARQSLEENPRSLVLYPEGTRSRDGRVQRFKKGGLILAIESNLPVVPVAICGSSQVLRKKSLQVHPAPVVLRVGQPMGTRHLTVEDRDWFSEQVRAEVVHLKSHWERQQG